MPPTAAQGFEWVPGEIDKFLRRSGFRDITDFVNSNPESRTTIYHSVKTGRVSLRVMELFAELGGDFGPLIMLKSPIRNSGRKGAKKPRRTSRALGHADGNP